MKYMLLLLMFIPALLIAEQRDAFGCTVRCDSGIYLVFSADSLFEGGPEVLDVLKTEGIKASFFFTGNFLRRESNDSIVKRVIAEGHYVGPHSDRHILLAEWNRGRTPLVTPDSLMVDLKQNYKELSRFGVTPSRENVVLPPFEWCSTIHAETYRRAGFIPINPSPEIETYCDYTTPDMPEYKSSEYMINQLFECEEKRGLDGAIIIFHAGTQDSRVDKLYHHLGDIIRRLKDKYEFHSFNSCPHLRQDTIVFME